MSTAYTTTTHFANTRPARPSLSTRSLLQQVGWYRRDCILSTPLLDVYLAQSVQHKALNAFDRTCNAYCSDTLLQVQRSVVTPFLGASRQPLAQPRTHACACRAVLTAERHAEQSKAALLSPWTDPKWLQYKWTVYRGVAYDLTSFIDRHPAGNWLINLAIGRDCTGLFESYHLRPRVASEQLKRLPVLQDFPVDAVPSSPYPNDSELYNTIRLVTKMYFAMPLLSGMH